MQSSHIRGISCLLDTDIIIDFLRHRSYAQKILEHWSEKGLLAISALTHLEIYQGMKASEAAATEVFLDGLITIDIDVIIARQAGTMLGELRNKEVLVSIADAIIAATAIQLNAPLLTNNKKRYRFAELKVI